ncbi:MAG: UvrD-helicase domain-containing protein [Spirochaetaceae bacterium]|jgi:superfamily I DNA/RNA helicase/PHP family Zn ribbon phosphoesterase|nr:UvrD-helicase domain-containing protein [Spirochaetaceae bacterium]
MIIADLHIHSRFSRATSPALTPASLERWARIKGIGLMGGGDVTHPAWLAELRENLDDAEDGLYILKESSRAAFEKGPALEEGLPFPAARAALSSASSGQPPRFVLSGEISTIYKKDGKTRKLHHVVLLPDFEAALRFQSRLEKTGNIRSDGRPILGVDSGDLLAMLLDADERALLIPAHIWTPWFSVLGSRSGFDSIEECYGKYTRFIPAVETGLSSNPPMNWAVPFLDGFSIISNSDAHSPAKLGREATILDMELSFQGLSAALKVENKGVRGTVEFFPQEGKYHYDGHRVCGVYMNDGTLICPVCGKPLTRGVMGRVLELAGRPVDEKASCPGQSPDGQSPGGAVSGNAISGSGESRQANANPYYSLIPLHELLGEITGSGPSSKKVSGLYSDLIEKAGSELSILMDADTGELGRIKGLAVQGELLAEAIRRMRSGAVSISPGYDGEYGVVRVFSGEKKFPARDEQDLFENSPQAVPATTPAATATPASAIPAATSAAMATLAVTTIPAATATPASAIPAATPAAMATSAAKGRAAPTLPAVRGRGKKDAAAKDHFVADGPARRPELRAFVPDEIQKNIIGAETPRAVIIAGPGTGKTAVLSERIKRLIREGAAPSSILALSFTVKAAAELRDRVQKNGAASVPALDLRADPSCAKRPSSGSVFTATFHSLAAFILRNEAKAAGLPADFSIIGEEERDALLAELCGAFSAGGDGAKKIRPRKLGAYIESRKRYLLLPGETEPPFDASDSGFRELLQSFAGSFGLTAPLPAMEALYGEYRKRLRALAQLDYDDLISGLARLFLRHENILARYQEQFRFIFVDEYQDVNFAQYILIRLLAPTQSGGPSLWVIGDPNQAIYGFRGSDKRFIDRFPEDYPDAVRFELTRSFRCALPIIQAAGLLSGREMAGSGEAVELFRAAYATDKAEAEGIARRISALIGGASFFAIDSNAAGSGEAAPEDCAILFRAGVMAAPFIKALEDHGIPYEYNDSAEQREEIPFNLPPAKGVSLLTMHASKGLEFDYVFVPGLEEGIVPFTLYDSQEVDIEEEKRLLYVAMTRARKGLNLSWAMSRHFRGRLLKGRPSRFLDELEKLVPIIKAGSPGKKDPQGELFYTP